MTDNEDFKAKAPPSGGGTCPFCGAGKSEAGYDDEWWCISCNRKYPTYAAKCNHPDCWEFVFLQDYCERHKSLGEKT
jgi:hypothetical protein